MKVPTDPTDLRIAVTNSRKTHPQKSQWIRSLFNGKARSFNRFVKEHSTPGTFVDNFGLLVLATSDYLNVIYHIVGTSNNKKDPVTVIGHKESRKVVFHIGYYQDTSDQGGVGARAGHWALPKPRTCPTDKEVPCCQVTVLDHNPADVDTLEMLRNEGKIVSIFPNDKSMVKQSLTRLGDVKGVSLDELCSTNILHI